MSSLGKRTIVESTSNDVSCFCSPFKKIAKSSFLNNQPIHDAETLVANELNELSLQERERVYEDIHGMPTVVDENPDFVANALHSMDIELEKIKRKPAYDKALFLSPRYVKKRSLRLMFLRAECFEPEAAAKRFVFHFEQKLELFGIDKLARDIRYDDLTEEEFDAYRTAGGAQLLPSKDRSGRAVVVLLYSFDRWEYQARVCWYLMMTNLIEDEESQRKGQVAIVYTVGPSRVNKIESPIFLNNVYKTIDGIPRRWTGFHLCYDDNALRPFVSVVQNIIGKQSRLRFRSHYGTFIECKYALLGYGIPADELPVNGDGTISMHSMEKYLNFLRVREQLESGDGHPSCRKNENNEIECPSKMDILLGRGRPYQEYIGNTYLFEIINKHQTSYDVTTRGEKWVLSNRVVRLAGGAGARFLRKSLDGDCWVEVDEEAAREKVSHTFRNKSRKRNQGKDTLRPIHAS